MANKSNWFLTLLGYADKEKRKFILSVLLSVISITSGLVPYYCIYKIIDAYAVNVLTEALIFKWCLLALLFYAVKVILYSLSTGLSHKLAYTVVCNLRKNAFDRFLHAPLGEVEKFTIGQIKNLVVDKIENLEPPLAHMVPEGAGHIFLPIVSIAALGFINPWLILASLITFPASIICMLLTFKISGESFEKYNTSNAYMNSAIVEYIEGIEVIKAFGKAGTSYEKYASAIKDYKVFVIKWMSSTWITMKLAFALFPSTLLGIVPVGLYLASKGSITASQMALAAMLSMSMITSLARLEVFTESINQMQNNIEEINSCLNLPLLPEKENNEEIIGNNVELSHISFSYTGKKEDEVLHDISLSLPKGSFTALVGPSGSGKSTIAKLIARFWDVNEGSISIGGKDIRDMSLKQLSSLVSFVTQDNFLFDTSLLENIRMGNPTASDEEVYDAARKAGCEDFIMKLPQKYDTDAGEAGKKLSGGEKQRIAIARMILKDAPIVILDEATAFTDPENEDKIQRSISSLTHGKTLIVIAHRLSTIKNADSIVVLNKGKIEAVGKQDELIASSPLYKSMWLSHIGSKNWAVGVSDKEGGEN